METAEISIHQLRVYLAAQSDDWLTSRDLAERSGVAQRTARHHALALSKLGVLDVAEVFPAHRYRVSPLAGKRNAGYIRRLEQAREAFGV